MQCSFFCEYGIPIPFSILSLSEASLSDHTVNYIPKHDTKKGDEMGKNVHNQNGNQRRDQDSES